MKVFILDFDKTCIKSNSRDKMPKNLFHVLWQKLSTTGQIDLVENPTLKVQKEEFFPHVKEVIDTIINNDDKVVICSFGSHDIIYDAFKTLEYHNKLSGIYTPRMCNGTDFHKLQNKSTLVEKIQHDLNVSKSDIYVFDDNVDICHEISSKGYNVHLCENGINQEVFQTVKDILNS